MPNASCHKLTAKARSRLLVALCCIIIVGGCRPDRANETYRKGLQENPTRQKIGMRLIEPNWRCFRSINGKDEWLTDPKSESAAVKTVQRAANDSLLSEIDSYRSGRLVKIDDSVRLQEEIKLEVDYATSRLKLVYLGDDAEIESWLKSADDNKARLEVIEKVKVKWYLSATPRP